MKKLLASVTLLASQSWAQCVMCGRTAAAQNAARAHFLNVGIIVLLIPPVLIFIGILLYAWRRSKAATARRRIDSRADSWQLPAGEFVTASAPDQG
jgi:hypothetical protein